MPPETTQTIGPSPGFAAQRGGQRQGARSFGDGSRLLRDQPHRLARLVERDGDGSVGHRAHPLPHPFSHALAARTVDERRLPVRELAGDRLFSAKAHKEPRSRALRPALSRPGAAP